MPLKSAPARFDEGVLSAQANSAPSLARRISNLSALRKGEEIGDPTVSKRPMIELSACDWPPIGARDEVRTTKTKGASLTGVSVLSLAHAEID
jgi:hypothetical protein